MKNSLNMIEVGRVTNRFSHLGSVYALAALGALATAVLLFLAFCKLVGTQLPGVQSYLFYGSLILLSVTTVALRGISRQAGSAVLLDVVVLSLLAAVGIALALATAYQMAAYIRLPVDLLSFSESPFVDKILRLRLGVPLYAPAQDNVSYPYTPGAEILTYGIAALFSRGDSIPAYRTVQFFYIILATLVATSTCDLLARRFLTGDEYRHRLLWVLVWLPLSFLVILDPRFNLYNHSLHNDGLALLISLSAFWLIVRNSLAPRPWQIIAMALLPALGFWVKQSLVIWILIFSLYLLGLRRLNSKQFIFFLIGSASAVAALVGIGYILWGEPFYYWVFQALGQKQVSILRDMLNLFDAGIYAIMGLIGGWLLAVRKGSRDSWVLWFCWLLFFGTEVYTSGFAFQRNHLGPGIVIAACWFFVTLVRIWSTDEVPRGLLLNGLRKVLLCISVILLLGTLGLVWDPRNPVPSDFDRYVAEIEAEFQGMDVSKVLMDTGSWIYLRENVLMKDRSAPVSVHVGKNQPEIGYAMLNETIQRIQAKTYDKILARELDTGETWYDYQDRGSGVKAAILANYQVVRRIPGVKGIDNWWPTHLVREVLVLVPKP